MYIVHISIIVDYAPTRRHGLYNCPTDQRDVTVSHKRKAKFLAASRPSMSITKHVVGGRPPRYAPAPLLSPWVPKRLAPPSRRQRSSSFPRPTCSHAHRCSRLTRQHGSEQSSLVTLTFDLLTLKVVSESRVMWATSVPILVFRGLSVLDLCPMYATDRQTDVRQRHRLMPPPSGAGA